MWGVGERVVLEGENEKRLNSKTTMVFSFITFKRKKEEKEHNQFSNKNECEILKAMPSVFFWREHRTCATPQFSSHLRVRHKITTRVASQNEIIWL